MATQKMKKIEYKVPGGKLLKISAMVESDKIKDIKIHGDFFAYPEESIEKLEVGLKNIPLEESKIREILENSLREVELIGISKEDLLHVLMKLKD
ncbi:MAG TPA: hypothetical protein ENG50_02185 [Candidatus Altiarchaeales archaeon]|nr:hypothetical protein [Candidatus Altiarchaeales archaeon]